MPPSSLEPLALLPAPVLVVEDEEPMRCKLERMLLQLGYQREGLIFASTLQQARAWLADNPAALALVDLGLPDGNGIHLIEELRALDPTVSILVVSSWSTEQDIMQALRAGATGYVLKERDDMEISLSIRSVLRGGAPIDPFVARHILGQLKVESPPVESSMLPGEPLQAQPTTGEVLTAREHQILRLVSEGLHNREIAEKLFLSRHTIECHIKHIYRKLAVCNRTKAVHAARSLGLLG